jgi:hypothetical protein
MDYRFDPPRWSQWPAVEAKCLSSVVDTTRNSRQSIFIGDTSGFIRRTDTVNQNIDTTGAINYKVTLPYLDFGNPVAMKTLARGAVGLSPTGDYTGTIGWSRDNFAQQTATFSMSGGDVLAGSTSDITIAWIQSIAGGTQIRISTFPIDHGWSAGDTVVIAGTTSYNGIHTIYAVTSARTFELDIPFVADEAGIVQTTTTSNYFTLGISTLAGARFVDRFFSFEEGGEFRSIQFQVTQSGINQDMQLHSLFAEIEPGADSTENN